MTRTRDGNAAIELHDSELQSLDIREGAAVAVLSAYVHRSPGRPGVDRGSGWSQTAEFRVAAGRSSGTVADLPRDLWSGTLETPGGILQNLIPAPDTFPGPVRVTLSAVDGSTLVILGERLDVVLLGEAEYLDEFEGDTPSVPERATEQGN